MQFIKKFILIILLLAPHKLFAEETFCIDSKGFIYPLFDNEKCEKNHDEITKEEFVILIDIEKDKRPKELYKFRSEAKETAKSKVQNKNLNEKEIAKLKDEIKKKQDEAKNLNSIEEKAKKRKLEIEKKAKKRKLEIKKRKLEAEKRKLEADKKRLAIKKQKELERKNKIAEQKRKREEAERKKLAEKKRKEIEKKRKIADKLRIKEEKERIKAEKEKHKNKIIHAKDVINELKIVYYDKKIVKNEILPKINPSDGINFDTLEDLNKNSVKDLFSSHANLIIIIPEDFEAFSTVSSENQLTSKYVAGTKSIPNPEFNRLQMEMRSTEMKLKRARQQEQYFFYQGQNSGTYSWADLLLQGANVAAQIEWGNRAKELQSSLNRIVNNFSSTPEYLEKEVLRSYNYVVQNIDAEKKAKFQIIISKDYNYLEKKIEIDEKKKFKIAYNIDPQDKNYNKLLNKYGDEKDILKWQNKKIINTSVEDILSVIEKETNFRELEGKNELYASLNFEIEENSNDSFKLPWWKKLIENTKMKDTQSASLNKNNSNDSFEEKDNRFNSVVIVKTENGLGSGFFVSKDEILTNYHVIENSSNISIVNRDNKRSSAVVIKKDLKRDLALLKTNFSGTPVKFYDGKLKQGEQVEALGHPKGRKFSLTKGWISAIRLESSVYNATNSPNVLFIQTDAAINPGNSGGPLFYKDRVIGVNTQGLSKEASEGMNFAVHFSEAKKFLDK